MSNSCETHLVPNCPICTKKPAALPAPLTNQPAPQVSLAVTSPTIAPPPPGTSSDPHAAKIVAAATKYAEYCDTFKTISDEIRVCETKMLDAKKRAANVATLRENAQAELVKLMGEKQ